MRWTASWRGLAAAACLASLAVACGSSQHGFAAPAHPHFSDPAYGLTAALNGPVTTGHIVEPESGLSGGLPAGYVEQEFFASGTAWSFRATASPSDGQWSIAPATSAAYRTRIIVRRPSDPARFNGTVVVEWLNVSAGEASPDWDYLNPGLTAAGFAYVGVSAQALGVNGGKSLLGSGPSGGLVGAEPSRYGSLVHPGDQYSYDMFAQIGRALRPDADPAALAGLPVRHVVAVGESQSAFFLTTFVDAVQPVTQAFDGFFIHSRGGTSAPLGGSSIASSLQGAGVRIRTDLGVPVFMFETETDLTELGYAAARQADTDHIRTWEVAGTSHADSYIVGGYATKLGCTKPINDGPQHEVVQAAFAAFGRWVAAGTPPPSPDPLQLASTQPVRLALDANGNALGGARSPSVDVPVSTLSGVAPPGTSAICSLFGSSVHYTPARLTQHYGSRTNYLFRFRASLARAVAGGYIPAADQGALIAQAEQVRFG